MTNKHYGILAALWFDGQLLFGTGWLGPTDIGLMMGYESQCASAKLTYALKRLLKSGRIVRSSKGKYRLADKQATRVELRRFFDN